jgi:hypothetical protein
MKARGWLILLGLAVLAFLAAYFASPIVAFNTLAEAARAGDRGRIERLVDFPALRESLKAQIAGRLQAQIQGERRLNDNPLGGLGFLLGTTMVDAVVDATVTPDGVAAMLKSSRPPLGRTAPGKTALPPPPETAPPAPADANGATKPKTSFAYRSLDRFDATTRAGTDTLTWVMRRRGLFGWKLTAVELPQ